MSIVLDLDNLEQYAIDGISFRGDQIKKWCTENLKNPDDNIKYAAKELYRNYFTDNIKRALKPNKYYYIIYGNAFVVGHLYSVIKDEILSPRQSQLRYPIEMKTVLQLIDKINLEISKIKNKTHDYDEDIEKCMSLMKSRLKRLGIRNKKGVKHVFYPAGEYKKHQIYNVINNCYEDIKVIRYMINKTMG